MNHLKNTRGLTLVEVMAVIIILFIVSSLTFSIIKSSVDQKTKQTKEAENLFDITYALKVVTKDIRRSTTADANTSELKLTFPTSATNVSATYLLEDGQLKKKNIRDVSGVETETTEIITGGIGCARFTSPDTHVISIEIATTSDCSESKKTEIQLRKES